jgi:hypothetical protein
MTKLFYKLRFGFFAATLGTLAFSDICLQSIGKARIVNTHRRRE